MLTGKQVIDVNVEQIMPNRYQPRDNIDRQKLESLAASIKKYGMIQPIILRKIGNMYEIVVGGRRFEASLLAGNKQVPAIIVNISDNDMASLTLTENMQRQELSPIEEAKSYKKLQDENSLSISDIAVQTGKSEEIIMNKLKLLTLAPEVQSALINNMISEGHAKLLIKIPSHEKQVEVLNKIINDRLPVKETNNYINNLNLVREIPNPNNEILPNTDTVSLSDLNKENLNIKSALNDLELVNTASATFNGTDQIIKEKKEEINMDMNSLNQAAQNNMPNQPQEPIVNNNESRFFPSFDNEPVNMNVPSQEPMRDATNYNINNTMPNYNMNNSQVAPEPVIPNPIPSFGMNPEIQAQPQNQVPNYGVNMTNISQPNPQVSSPITDFGAMNQMPNMAQEPQMQSQNFGSSPISDFRVEPTTPSMPNIMNSSPSTEIPVVTPNLVDITPAINNTRTFITTLESMGFKVTKEEQDNGTEYQFIIKIQK